jgi:hypothetical protein
MQDTQSRGKRSLTDSMHASFLVGGILIDIINPSIGSRIMEQICLDNVLISQSQKQGRNNISRFRERESREYALRQSEHVYMCLEKKEHYKVKQKRL